MGSCIHTYNGKGCLRHFAATEIKPALVSIGNGKQDLFVTQDR
jgi:hypothetical protein